MKRKTHTNQIRYFIAFILIFMTFPVFFRANPKLRFLWGIISSACVCMQIFYLTSHSSRRKKRFMNTLLLLFSTLMAYDMGNWESFKNIFPSISEISQPLMILRILIILFCAGLLGGTLLALRRQYARSRRSLQQARLIEEQTVSAAAAAAASTAAPPDEKPVNKTVSKTVRRPNTLKPSDNPTLGKLIGFSIIFIGVIAAAIGTTAFLLKNREVLEKLDLHSIQLLVNTSAWFILLLCLSSILLVSIAYVIWLIKAVITDTLRNKKFTLENPPFLKLLSYTLLLVVGVVFYNTDIDGWFSFLKKPDEIAPLLKGLLIAFLLILLSQVAYRMLFSLFTPDSSIRIAANRLYAQFLKCAANMLMALFTPVPKASGFLKNYLPVLSAILYQWIKCYFFDADVSKTGVEKKIWYPFAWGSLFFSIVSFIGTANGMSKCIFNGNRFVSALVSMGIQVFLLTFNLHLPKLLKNSTLFKKRITLTLYAMIIVSSSFFSFTFIAQTIYEGTWMQDAHIEMSDNFIYASNQLHAMSDELYQSASGDLSEVIISIQQNLSSSASTLNRPDFTEIQGILNSDPELNDLVTLLTNTGNISVSALNSYSQDLNSKGTKLDDKLKQSENDLEKTEAKIEKLEDDINALIRQRYTVTLNSPAHVSYTEQIEGLKLDQQNSRDQLDKEKLTIEEYRKQADAISQLAAYLHSLESQSSGIVSIQLSEILSQLSSSSPDFEQIDRNADVIYRQITQNAVTPTSGSINYSAILAQITTFKTSLSSLQAAGNAQNWLKDNQAFIFEADSLVSANASENDIKVWRSQWNTALSGVKNHLSALEPYVNAENKAKISSLSGRISVLKRNYLLDLNIIETAQNCLMGSHPTLARVALLIAFYLDTAPVFVSFILADKQTSHPSRRRAHAGAAYAGANLALLIFALWPWVMSAK